jgi:4'-phosphopantetheinyl transferase
MVTRVTVHGALLPEERHRDVPDVEVWSVRSHRPGPRTAQAAEAATRHVLGRYLKREPAELRFIRGAFGKPRLAETGAGAAHFSTSRSGVTYLIAVSRGRSVGVDVEQLEPLPDLDSVARRLLAPAEVEAIARAPEHLRTRWFYNAWTRKEAYVKAVGAGVTLSFSSFVVSVDDDVPRMLESDRGDADAWTIRSFEPAANVVGAVVVRATGHEEPTFTLRHTDAPTWR